MRIVIQRVKEASVTINNELISKVQRGLLILIGIEDLDTEEDINWLTQKVVNLRVFDDENGVMNKSILDTGGDILSISQFTLYGDAKKGNRPSYIKALGGSEASPMYDQFNEMLREHVKVETGIFGSEMKVSLINDGPVTILLEKERD